MRNGPGDALALFVPLCAPCLWEEAQKRTDVECSRQQDDVWNNQSGHHHLTCYSQLNPICQHIGPDQDNCLLNLVGWRGVRVWNDFLSLPSSPPPPCIFLPPFIILRRGMGIWDSCLDWSGLMLVSWDGYVREMSGLVAYFHSSLTASRSRLQIMPLLLPI